MLEELLEEKKEEIDSSLKKHKLNAEAQAEKDKRAAEYIIQLIESDPKHYVEVFGVSSRPLGISAVEHLYDSIKKTLNSLYYELGRTEGMASYNLTKDDKPKDPAYSLGWIRLEREKGERANEAWERGEKVLHSPKITEKGMRVVREYFELP